MCGICGVVALDSSPLRDAGVAAMTASLHHRGPDDRGAWSAAGISLGATRLSILDPTPAGHQPMTSGDWTLAYNGEVYNFASIRRELDVSFHSQGDTEVVLEAIRAWGPAAIARLDGMFALAAWNARTRTLLLARDRFGVKPLYYARAGSELAFASEIRALLVWRPELAEVRAEAIEEYLTFRDVAGEDTLFRRIQRVLPGHLVSVEQGRVRTEDWRTTLAASPEPTEDVLARSVREQLVSDVPIGALCSGGIDSGLLTVLAARQHNGPMHTFSVAFPGFALDESQHAAAIAERAGTIHHVLVAEPHDLAEDLATLTRHNDEPVKYPNSIPLYRVCRMAREHGVIVLLTGEGADEMFGGYARFVATAKLARVRRWQKALPLAKHIRWSRVPLPNRARSLAYRLVADSDDILLHANALTSSAELALLLGRAPRGELAYRRRMLARTRGLDLAERMRAYDIDTYLPPLLLRQDKMSMAASVESRVPMLGNAVAAHALSTPARKLADGRRSKLPLRRVADRLLPRQTVERTKIGFATPSADWLRASSDLLSLLTANSRSATYIDQRLMTRLVDEHRTGRADRGELLWTLLALEVWLRECVAR